MADRDVEFDILARDKSGPAVKGAADGLDKLGRKSDEAKRDLEQLERETGQLGRKMLETKAAAALLAREFAKTGDAKVYKDFQRLEREATKMGKALAAIKPPKIELPEVKQGKDDSGSVFRKLFGNLVDEAQKAGKLAGDAAISGIGDAFGAIPAEAKLAIGGALVGAALLAAPAIVAVVDAAVLAGVGAGGLAAGIALAAQDPVIAEAFSALGNDILTSLKTAATVPFRGELLDTAGTFGAAFKHELPRVEQMFRALATTVKPITAGMVGGLENLAPGLQAAVNASLPLLRTFAADLPELGRAVGSLFDAFARGGPGAAFALHLLMAELQGIINFLDLGIRMAAPFLNVAARVAELTGMYQSASSAGGDLGRTAGELSDTLTRQVPVAGALSADYHLLASSLGNTANQADALNASFGRLFSEAMNLDQANLAVKTGMLQLTETLKGNKKTLNENTAAGQENAGAVLAQIQALDQKRQAEIAAGNGTKEATDKANAAYAGNLSQLRGLLATLGFTKSEVDGLIAKYEELARPRSTTFTTHYRSDGTPAMGNSRNLPGQTGGLDGWQPAAFADGQRAQLADPNAGTFRIGGPRELTSTVNLRVDLDGRPFRAYTDRTVREENDRREWRRKVGKR